MKGILKNKTIQNKGYYIFFLFVVIALIFSSCSRRYSDLPVYSPIAFDDYDNKSVGRFKTSYLAEQIDEYYKGINPGPIGISSFVNIDDLHTTSTFGRMLGEQLMSELAMRGYEVVELRHSSAIEFLPNDGGEFALSRNVKSLRKERDLGGVVVGTYIVSPVRVYLNARLLNPTTSVILSAASAEMSKSKEIDRMLKSGGDVPTTLERVPIKDVDDDSNTKFFDKNELKKTFGF